MREQTLVSFDLARYLYVNGCNLPTEFCWISIKNKRFLVPTKCVYGYDCEYAYPAFDLLNDICVRHSEKFFGGEEREIETFSASFSWGGCFSNVEKCNRVHSIVILDSMRDGQKQEAEEYFLEHTIFNPKNKEK